jgi:hypothetical protein
MSASVTPMRINFSAPQAQRTTTTATTTTTTTNANTNRRQPQQQPTEANGAIQGTDVLNLRRLREILNSGWNCNNKVYYQEDGEWRQTLVWYAVHFDKQEALRMLLSYRGGGNDSLIPNAETIQMALRHSKDRCRYGCTLLIEAELRRRRGEDIGPDFHINLVRANAAVPARQTAFAANSRNPSSNRGYEATSSSSSRGASSHVQSSTPSATSSDVEISDLAERFESIEREAARSGLSRLPELLSETRKTINTLRHNAVNNRVEIFEIESKLFAKKRELEQMEADVGKLEVLALDLESYIGASRQGSPSSSDNGGAEGTIEEGIICNICQERKKNRALNCGHVFCSDCVRHCQEGNNACFNCRKAISHVITIYL